LAQKKKKEIIKSVKDQQIGTERVEIINTRTERKTVKVKKTRSVPRQRTVQKSYTDYEQVKESVPRTVHKQTPIQKYSEASQSWVFDHYDNQYSTEYDDRYVSKPVTKYRNETETYYINEPYEVEEEQDVSVAFSEWIEQPSFSYKQVSEFIDEPQYESYTKQESYEKEVSRTKVCECENFKWNCCCKRSTHDKYNRF